MKKDPRFSGVFTALITPFKKGKVDFKSLKKLLRQQMDGGVDGFVVNGTTAESPTLSSDEVTAIFRFVKKETDKAVPLVLGVGTNSTATTAQNMKVARRLGADAALVVVPYYNKPPQRALIEHFKSVAKAAPLPVILYNIPGRTVVSMSVDTILKLQGVKNIVGIKEGSGDLAVVDALVASGAKKFLLSSGDDGSCIEFILRGGHGVVSVISHVIPREMTNFATRARQGDESVRGDYRKYSKLNALLSLETNPIPVKSMLHMMGVIESPELRLPLLQLVGENIKTVATEMRALGLIR